MSTYSVASFVIAGLLLTGCTTLQYELHPQSHFDYPNSNINPLGKVVGEASQTALFTPPQLSGEVERHAINAALKTKPGADILLNYVSETKVTTLLGLLFILNYKVEGTAAAMSVGLQDLR